MLKKAGIVVAAVAATTVAAAPLAFAGDVEHGKSHGVRTEHHHSSHDRDRDRSRDIDIDYNVDNSVDDSQSNRCNFGQSSRNSRNGLLGVVSLLGQTQALDCTNIDDLVDVNLNTPAAP